MTTTIRRLTLAACLLAVVACTGDAGPTGPQGSTGAQGPQGLIGPQGPPGSAMVMLTGTLDGAGAGMVHLPTVAGTIANPPLVTCYLAQFASSQVWLVMATDDLLGSCGMGAHGSHVDVGFVNGPAFWALRVIAVYSP